MARDLFPLSIVGDKICVGDDLMTQVQWFLVVSNTLIQSHPFLDVFILTMNAYVVYSGQCLNQKNIDS